MKNSMQRYTEGNSSHSGDARHTGETRHTWRHSRHISALCAMVVLMASPVAALGSCPWGTSFFVAENLLFANTADARS